MSGNYTHAHTVCTRPSLGRPENEANKDLETCMNMIEDIRRKSIYLHPESDCGEECKLIINGCGKCWVTDGIWS